jgi:uncharacterized membrane protein YfcA
MDIIVSLLVILAAYFLKGLSGFGPALIMIPFLTIIYDPATAIILTAFLDFLAGAVLIPRIRKDISWPFVVPVIISMGIGAVFGAYLLGQLPVNMIRQIMGLAIAAFALYLLFQKNSNHQTEGQAGFIRYPIGILSGLSGGLLGISGPPIVIFMKMFYDKVFFRTQLIVIFLFGSGWRLILYYLNKIENSLDWRLFPIFIVTMILGVLIGNKIHIQISEKVFNRLVAIIIFVTAIRMLF